MDIQSSVVAETADYQITLNQGHTEATVLLVTFDYIGADKKPRGFGTSQAMANGADNLHVSQRQGTSYQYLSRAALASATRDIFPNYARVLFFGHSLGGYAALYFSWVQNAEVFAICPRCPAHPMFSRLLTKYSQKFLHEPIQKSPDSFWTVLWDPEDHDNRFIENFVGLKNIDRDIRVQELGHDNAPKILTLNGSLQRYLVEWITQRPISALPSFDEGSNFILLRKTAENLIKLRKFREAVPLLEKSIRLSDTPKARNLLVAAQKGLASDHRAPT
ncbi:MAG: hypothetical protein JJU15_19620 [Pararhodobacter sp.]|nr:hypothetical protein [Pararhodobacter sp.]